MEVVMISGQDRIDVAVNTMKYGTFDYIVKGEGSFLKEPKKPCLIFTVTINYKEMRIAIKS